MLGSLFNEVAGLKDCNFIKIETPTYVSLCEIREIFKNTIFNRKPLVTPFCQFAEMGTFAKISLFH